jgi:hypothetical protein
VARRPGLIDDLTRRLHRPDVRNDTGSPPPIQSDGTRADLVNAIKGMFKGR